MPTLGHGDLDMSAFLKGGNMWFTANQFIVQYEICFTPVNWSSTT